MSSVNDPADPRALRLDDSEPAGKHVGYRLTAKEVSVIWRLLVHSLDSLQKRGLDAECAEIQRILAKLRH